MGYKLGFEDYNRERMAVAIGRALPISTKHSAEICSFIRGLDLQKAKKLLEAVIKKKIAVPFKRYKRDIGHKPGIGAGRYPTKASEAILHLLREVEASAQNKGMNTAKLKLIHIKANKAAKQLHFGRRRARTAKRTHVEIVVEEK